MSFRQLSMTDVRGVIHRWQEGQSARQIARAGVVDRKTALRYIETARRCGIEPQSDISDELVAEVARKVQARPHPPPSSAWQTLEARRAQIEGWLMGPKPLRLVRVQKRLALEGVQVTYSTLRRFAHRELGWRERPSGVSAREAPPASEALAQSTVGGRDEQEHPDEL